MKNKNYLKLNLKFIFRLFSLLILAGAFSLNSFGQTQTFTTNGNFVVPAGVTTVQVEAWGGGGAGGGVTSSANRGGGGGAGGTYTKNLSVAVTPGASISVTVGAGGVGASSANGPAGGTSTFGSAVPVNAVGGGGGNLGNGTTNYGAGAGTATGITFNGGAGSAASSSTSNSGAGGGGAGSSGSGSAASGATGGTGGAGGGGTGAAGITSGSSDGTDATGLSAGGGGARGNSSNSSSRSGGNGSNGQVKVTWTCPSYALTAASGVTPICNSGGGTSTITLTGSAAGLPAGAYTVTYNRSLPSATGLTAAMTVTVAGSGSFTATGLTTGGSSTITVTSLTSGAAGGTCVSTISANNTSVITVNAAPTISVQPSAQGICPGFPVTFSVTGTGSPAPTYQWKKAGVDISGATNSSFNIASVSAGDVASYTVVLANLCGSLTSGGAALTLNSVPSISVHPSSQTKCTGTSVSFSVTASGTPAPTYQWRKDGVNISGATSASYNIASVAVGSAAAYDVVVSNTCGNLASNAANLTVNAAPAISVQPSAQGICSGLPVTFSVTGTGTPAPTYQWRKAGVDISGATNSSFNITSVSSGDAASYTVVLTNSCSSLTSSGAALTVNSAPAISVNPASQTKCTGTSVTFNATASGTPAPTYQWRKDGVNISGATTASYNIASVVVGSAAAYDVVVTNTCATAASTAAALTVNVTPTANASNNGPICSGNTLNLSSNSTGVTYLWSGPASFSSTLQSPTRPNALTSYSGTYTITVTDIANGCTASTTSGATVNATPATSASNNSAICAGSTLTLTGGPSSQTIYSWVGPNGYTSSSQSPSRSNAQTNYSGTYTLTVTSSAGCSASASTTATVNALPIASAGNNGPVCQGSNLNLSASGGASYAWTGPNSYTSTSQNPSITGVDGGDVGTYTVTVTLTGCTASASTVLSSIKTLPVPAPAATPGNVCSNSAVSLSSKQDVTARNVNDFSIPNVNSTGITSQIPISAFSPATLSAATIKSVAFNIDHTQTGDLEITLIAPGGSSILLVNNRGGSGDDFTNTTIVNSGGANGNVSAGSAPFTGTYNTETAFSGLTGNANGTWGLKVVDNNSSSNSGTLLNWTLTLVSNGVTYNWSSSPAGFSSALQNPTGNPSQNTTYTVDATLSGCIASGSVAITTIPVPEPYAFTNAPICSASGLFLFGNNNAAGQATGNTWSWKNPNNVVFSTVQNPNISNAVVANTGIYTLTVTNSSGCTATATTQVVINPNPVLSIATQTNVSCNGLSDGSINIDANNGTPLYTFTLDGNASLDGIYNGLSAGNYSASVIDDNGCEATTLAVNITQPAVLVASAASNSPACTGTSLNFSGSQSGGTGGYNYLWTGPNGFNSTSQNPTINAVTQIIAGQYDLQITDANGCIANASHVASIITSPTAEISYNGPNSICLSQSTNLQLAFTGTGPWTYVVNGSGGPYSGTTSSNPLNLNVTPLSAGEHDYTIVTIGDAHCPLSGTASGIAKVNVITAPPSNTVGALVPAALEACAGSVMMITVNTVGGQNINYQWNTGSNSSVVLFSTNASGPFTPAPFQTSSPLVYAQFGSLLAGNSGYNICVQGVNGCGNTNNKCTWIRGIVGVPGTITPAANVVACPNEVKSYSCGLSGGASTYNWTLSGSTAAIISGQGTANVSVEFPSVFTSGQLCVTASLPCGGSSTSAPRCVTINNTPSIPSPITGVSKVCPGATGVALSVPVVPGATGYNWTVPAGATIVAGSNTNAITVNFPNPFPGANVCVTATGACATSVARCKAVGTNIPAQPGFITGPASNICNSTVQYSIANVSGANSYTWSIPGGTNIISGQGGTTILLNVGSTFTSGQITVAANTSACTPGTSVPRIISVNGKPNTPASITANPGVWCSGGSVNFSVDAVSPLPTYNWVITNGIIDAGQGTNNIDVTWGLSSAGGVNVSASNSCGISGIRSQSFSSSCREETPLENNNQDVDFLIYPNPARDNVSVSIYAEENASYMIRLTDISGRVINAYYPFASSGMNKYEMNTSSLAKGVYMLEVQINDKLMKKKLIIQ